MKYRSKPFECAIAGRTVGIVLRHGSGIQEPRGVYVRCDERECQYVDLNRPPCPLRVEMFTQEVYERLRAYLMTHSGRRICYECVMTELSLTHTDVRRASWCFDRSEGFSVHPGRCFLCRRRCVTMGIRIAGAAPRRVARPAITVPAPRRHAPIASGLAVERVSRDEPAPAEPDVPRRVITALLESDAALCATCVAFAADVALSDARRVVDNVTTLASVMRTEGTCAACGRQQPVIRFADETSDATRVTEVADLLHGRSYYRGFRVDLLSYRAGGGWRPFALIRTSFGSLAPDIPPIVTELVPTKIEADELAAARAHEWIDKRFA